MSYFKSFPRVLYEFGDGEFANVQNITAYSEIVDEIKNKAGYYLKHHILSGERPDQTAFKLYGDANLHWILYLTNDTIRERGWPLTYEEVLEKSRKDFPGVVLRTKDKLFGIFAPGQTVKGNESGSTGTIKYRDLKLGHVVLEDVTGDFKNGELVTSEHGDEVELITIVSSMREHLAPKHYIDGNEEIVDFDPFHDVGEFVTPVTNLEYYLEENDKLREINVLKPSVVAQVVSSIREAMRS